MLTKVERRRIWQDRRSGTCAGKETHPLGREGSSPYTGRARPGPEDAYATDASAYKRTERCSSRQGALEGGTSSTRASARIKRRTVIRGRCWGRLRVALGSLCGVDLGRTGVDLPCRCQRRAPPQPEGLEEHLAELQQVPDLLEVAVGGVGGAVPAVGLGEDHGPLHRLQHLLVVGDDLPRANGAAPERHFGGTPSGGVRTRRAGGRGSTQEGRREQDEDFPDASRLPRL